MHSCYFYLYPPINSNPDDLNHVIPFAFYPFFNQESHKNPLQLGTHTVDMLKWLYSSTVSIHNSYMKVKSWENCFDN